MVENGASSQHQRAYQKTDQQAVGACGGGCLGTEEAFVPHHGAVTDAEGEEEVDLCVFWRLRPAKCILFPVLRCLLLFPCFYVLAGTSVGRWFVLAVRIKPGKEETVTCE